MDWSKIEEWQVIEKEIQEELICTNKVNEEEIKNSQRKKIE